MQCEPDVRRKVAENIHVIGGIAMVPGIKERLNLEIKHLVTTPQSEYSQLQELVAKFAYVNPMFPANCLAWVGGMQSLYYSSMLTVHRICDGCYR